MGALAALLLLAVSPLGAAADTEVGSAGRVGRYSLHDSRAHPGAICRYASVTSDDESGVQLVRVTVRPPLMYARRPETTQRVGWRARLQTEFGAPGPRWQTVATVPIEQATATYGRPADLSRQHFGDGTTRTWLRMRNVGIVFRVLVDMFWYGGGAVAGGVASRLDVMELRFPDGSLMNVAHTCYGNAN